jgi:Nucleoporin protein Ndc1-Nup
VLEDSCDEVLFGDAQRISHAAQALANLVVASRSPVANEDRYGVAQRTLVDVVTSLLQCHASCRAFNDSQLLQTRSVLSQGGGGGGGGGGGPNSTFAVDERHRARLVEDALAHAVRQIVAAFRTHLRGYLDAQEPRWAGRFNATLAHFLKASDRGAPPAAPRSPF